MRFATGLCFALLVTATCPAQFLETDYSGWLPDSPDPFLQALKEKELRFYRHTPAFQLNDTNGFRLIRTSFPLAGTRDLSGNANFEFPWRHTAGLITGSNWTTATFIYLPGPIKYKITQRMTAPYSWRFPVGTITGELMFVSDKEKKWHLFEMRTRERKEVSWLSRQFVPSMTYDHEGTVTKQIVGFRVNEKVKLGILKEQDAGVLDGAEFIEGGNNYTTNEFSLVPKGYVGAIARCVTCHKQIGMTADQISREQGRFREWYGVVRGSDEVFSFSIFDPRSVGDNVVFRSGGKSTPVQIDQRLVKLGLLEKE